MITKEHIPVQSCINCHFFLKEIERHQWEITLLERDTLKHQADLKIGNYKLACFMGVWDDGYIQHQNRHEQIVTTDRTNYCFFWKYTPGMLFPAAKILQERETQNRELLEARNLTNRSIQISNNQLRWAIIGLVASIILASCGLSIQMLPYFGKILPLVGQAIQVIVQSLINIFNP